MVRKVIIVVLTFVVLGAVLWTRSEHPPTSSDAAYRICGACGLDVSEVDQLIDDLRHNTLSREANLDLFRDTFERREDAELCIGCAEAVMDAAGR